jgi:hypothetical protein
MSLMFPFLRSPQGILLSFSAAMLAVALFTIIDSGRRRELEEIVYPTSAGDTNFFRPANPLSRGAVMVQQTPPPMS